MSSPLDEFPHALSGRLLVVSDYDGTLTPIVDRPEQAAPDADLIHLLERLCAAPGVTVAILSGRSLAELEDWLGLPELILVGCHGAEWRKPGSGSARFLAREGVDRDVDRVAAALEKAVGGFAGAKVERKRFSVAAHYRLVAEGDLDSFRAGFVNVAAEYRDGFDFHEGKKVHELRPEGIDKGRALLRMREVLGLEDMPAIVIGDDTTDEDAFAVRCEGDLTVRVGEGATCADALVEDAGAVRTLLAELLRRREEGGA